MNYLYHGSSHRIKVLKPRSSNVINGEKAVFATNSKDLAVFFIAKTSDCDIELGYYAGQLYAVEQYPNAFNLLKNVSGYVYSVDSKLFHSDSRLGMQKHEFICKKAVKVLKTEIIKNVYEYLIKSPTINMITHDQKYEAIRKYNLSKKK
jgi:gamma-glutamylcyclotransferase (GGCT)/AIG2-like uncharacterized protein YtfP